MITFHSKTFEIICILFKRNDILYYILLIFLLKMKKIANFLVSFYIFKPEIRGKCKF